MNKENLSKYILNSGKIIAILSALLAFTNTIPTNGVLQWTMLIIALIFIVLGKKLED